MALLPFSLCVFANKLHSKSVICNPKSLAKFTQKTSILLLKMISNLHWLILSYHDYYKSKTSIYKKDLWRPWQDSNLQSSDPKSDALSIRPHGLVWYCVFEIGTKTKFIRLRIDGYTRTLLFRIYRNGTTSCDVLRHHYQNDFIIEQKWKELINFSTFICSAFFVNYGLN